MTLLPLIIVLLCLLQIVTVIDGQQQQQFSSGGYGYGDDHAANDQFEGGNWQNGGRNRQNNQFGGGNWQNGGRNWQNGGMNWQNGGRNWQNDQFGGGNWQNGNPKGGGNGQIVGQNSQGAANGGAQRIDQQDQVSTSCDRIARNNPANAIADQLIKAGLLSPIEDYSSRQTLSSADIARTIKFGCVPQLNADSNDCANALCYHLVYRSIDGVCNNLERPVLGAAFRPYMRYLPAEYSDGFAEPAGFGRRPIAREASRLILAKGAQLIHGQINSLFMQWGQFTAQEMAKSTFPPADATCFTCDAVAGKCMPVPISDQDNNAMFRQKGCLKVSRSASVCGTGDQQGNPREQLNENTAFVDGSPIYGSNAMDLLKVRDGRTGFLKMSRFNNMMVLPFDSNGCASAANRGTCAISFVSGDSRVNVFVGLASLYILFVREHNRIARVLQSLNRAWSGDRLFQETRKIVGAEIQAVLYNDFLPLALGPSSVDRLIGPYTGYAPNTDPTVANEFTAAAFRFGHATIVEQYSRLIENGQPIPAGPLPFNEGTTQSQKLLFDGGIDPLLRGLWSTPIKRPQQITVSVTERLFSATDLGTLNIMRGRDHGIASYNKMRRLCGLNAANTFDDLAAQITDPAHRTALASLYASPDDIDLYVGGLVEAPLIGALVGPTFACIIGDQFKRTRDGDRFYYENPRTFSSDQLAELRKTSLARLLCANGDHITHVPSNAFLLPSVNGTVSCAVLPQLDLRKWRE